MIILAVCAEICKGFRLQRNGSLLVDNQASLGKFRCTVSLVWFRVGQQQATAG